MLPYKMLVFTKQKTLYNDYLASSTDEAGPWEGLGGGVGKGGVLTNLKFYQILNKSKGSRKLTTWSALNTYPLGGSLIQRRGSSKSLTWSHGELPP